MEILPKLFGSKERAKLMRLFVFNPNLFFSQSDVVKRLKVSTGVAKRELSLLEEIGFLTAKKLNLNNFKETPKKASRTKKANGKDKVWQVNPDFYFIENIRSMFNADFLASRDDLADRFKNCGKVKLVLLSGIFVQEGGGRADLLVVGDDLKRGVLDGIISSIEAEIGRELVYAVLDTTEYFFRLSSSDRFVRDILDYPHRCLIDKINA